MDTCRLMLKQILDQNSAQYSANYFDRAKCGDIEAFEKLVECYEKRIFNIIYKVFRDVDYASELAQQVFVSTYKSIGNIDSESMLPDIIYKTTSRICMNGIRKRNISG